MRTERTPLEAITAIGDMLNGIKAAKDVDGTLRVGDAIDALLDVRHVARETIATMAELADRDALLQKVRLAMALIEFGVDDFIRAQPHSSAEEDQRLMEAITTPYNDLADDIPELQRRERRDHPTVH